MFLFYQLFFIYTIYNCTNVFTVIFMMRIISEKLMFFSASNNKMGLQDPSEIAEVSKMAQQVKEVLPDTPLSVIEKDLCKFFLD